MTTRLFSATGQAIVSCHECDRGTVLRSNNRHLRCYACQGTGVRLLDVDTLLWPLKSAARSSSLSLAEVQRLALVARRAASEAMEVAGRLDVRARAMHEQDELAAMGRPQDGTVEGGTVGPVPRPVPKEAA